MKIGGGSGGVNGQSKIDQQPYWGFRSKEAQEGGPHYLLEGQ